MLNRANMPYCTLDDSFPFFHVYINFEVITVTVFNLNCFPYKWCGCIGNVCNSDITADDSCSILSFIAEIRRYLISFIADNRFEVDDFSSSI